MLGAEFARAILMRGGIPIIADQDIKSTKDLRDKLLSDFPKGTLDIWELNINSEESINQLIDHLKTRFGKIDACVNNAYPRNANYGRPFFEVQYEDFCENINLHLGGYFLMNQKIASYFLDQGYGNIINIASIYGVIPPRFEVYDGTGMTMPVEYAAIKSALIHLTRYIAKYLKGNNIRVNSISPGGIQDNQDEKFVRNYTAHTLSKGMLKKSDLSGTLVFLLSDMSEFINGQNLIVDDGFVL